MTPLTKDEKRKALDSFSAYDEPELEIVGRSELERWAECPAQADLIESGKEGPKPGFVETGEQVHQAIGKAIQAWIDSEGAIGPQGVRDALEQALRGSRPDVQPHVIAAARASIWQFGAFLALEVNPVNILHFDGGEGELAGQLAMDLPTAGIRFTGEVDLLWQGPSRGVLQLEDWKSGWRFHRGGDVYTSFQFQSYAALALDNYPDSEAVECRVWNTRQGTKTYPVLFERRHLDNYLGRIHGAAQSRHDHRDNPEPWPVAEKCGVCPVAIHCPVSGDAGIVASDPALALKNYIALGAKYGAMGKSLAAHVKHHGPIQLETGERFASEHKSKPRTQLIVPKGGKKAEESDDDSDD